MKGWWNNTYKGKPKYLGKNSALMKSVRLHTIWTELGWSPDIRGDRPATDSLSLGLP